MIGLATENTEVTEMISAILGDLCVLGGKTSWLRRSTALGFRVSVATSIERQVVQVLRAPPVTESSPQSPSEQLPRGTGPCGRRVPRGCDRPVALRRGCGSRGE